MDDKELDDYIETGQQTLSEGLTGSDKTLYDLALGNEALLGQRFRALREKRHMSQEQVCEQLGHFGLKVHQTTLAKIERGKRPIRIAEAHLLAAVFDLPLVAVYYLDLGEDSRSVDLLQNLIQSYDRQIAHYKEQVQRIQGDFIENLTQDMARRQRAVQRMEALAQQKTMKRDDADSEEG